MGVKMDQYNEAKRILEFHKELVDLCPDVAEHRAFQELLRSARDSFSEVYEEIEEFDVLISYHTSLNLALEILSGSAYKGLNIQDAINLNKLELASYIQRRKEL